MCHHCSNAPASLGCLNEIGNLVNQTSPYKNLDACANINTILVCRWKLWQSHKSQNLVKILYHTYLVRFLRNLQAEREGSYWLDRFTDYFQHVQVPDNQKSFLYGPAHIMFIRQAGKRIGIAKFSKPSSFFQVRITQDHFNSILDIATCERYY